MMRSTFCDVDISRYIASNCGWGSRWLVIDSMTATTFSPNRRRSNSQTRGHTRDVLLEDVELLEDGVEEALRVLVDDEDLPSPRRAHRADRLEELCGSGSCMSCMRGLLAAWHDALDLTVLISDIFVRYSLETETDELALERVVSDDGERRRAEVQGQLERMVDGGEDKMHVEARAIYASGGPSHPAICALVTATFSGPRIPTLTTCLTTSSYKLRARAKLRSSRGSRSRSVVIKICAWISSDAQKSVSGRCSSPWDVTGIL